jgi:hypothetical protein
MLQKNSPPEIQATREIGPGRAHFDFSWRASSAALWTAFRMRTYVPHRQMFPDNAASISASLGAGLDANSAAADMICPDWQ